MNQFAAFYWNPDRAILPFDLPFLGRPLLWYGVLFALGFFLAYYFFLSLLKIHLRCHPQFKIQDPINWVKFFEIIGRPKSLWQAKLSRFLMAKLTPHDNQLILLGKFTKKTIKSLRVKIVKGLNQAISQKSLLQNYSDETKNLGDTHSLERRNILEAIFYPTLGNLALRVTYLGEKILFYSVLGTVIGARLGDVIFYQDWHQIVKDPLSVFRVWEGGLASHGGVLGVFFALAIFYKRYKSYFRWSNILDIVSAPAALLGGFIRIGNFINQEILGIPTSMPWGVVFGNPADGSSLVPRHPVQLYEAIFYFSMSGLFYYLFRVRSWHKYPGKVSGLFLIFAFAFRFYVEFLKLEQSVSLQTSAIHMGQWLSLPLLAYGFYLFFRDSK